VTVAKPLSLLAQADKEETMQGLDSGTPLSPGQLEQPETFKFPVALISRSGNPTQLVHNLQFPSKQPWFIGSSNRLGGKSHNCQFSPLSRYCVAVAGSIGRLQVHTFTHVKLSVKSLNCLFFFSLSKFIHPFFRSGSFTFFDFLSLLAFNFFHFHYILLPLLTVGIHFLSLSLTFFHFLHSLFVVHFLSQRESLWSAATVDRPTSESCGTTGVPAAAQGQIISERSVSP
jgi:hypothetical protein